jgi:hypothetical protein
VGHIEWGVISSQSRMRELLREIEVQCDPRQREYGVIHSTMATEAAAAPSTAAADEESEEEFDRCVCERECVRLWTSVVRQMR